MNDLRKAGYLYVLQHDRERVATPKGFLEHCVAPVHSMIGEELYWFGWNEETICLPGRSKLDTLKDDPRLYALSYLSVFSEGAEATWQIRGDGKPLARLCLETEVGTPATPAGIWSQNSVRGPFLCRPSRRILIGVTPASERGRSGPLFELRYPRGFTYEGIECTGRERVKADVYEYLDLTTHRLTLVRYRSIGTICEHGGESA